MSFIRIAFFFILVFLHINLQPAYGQSIMAAYKKLPPPERKWVRHHLFIAGKTHRVTQQVMAIYDAVKKDSLLKGPESGGQLDAFRHALWMAMLAKEFGEKRALQLGKAHEKSNRLFFEQRKSEDGILPDSVGCALDLANNQIGALLGTRNRHASNEALSKLIIQQIKEGQFFILRTNAEGFFLNCRGEHIDLSLYRNQWIIPKCIVPSNQIP